MQSDSAALMSDDCLSRLIPSSFGHTSSVCTSQFIIITLSGIYEQDAVRRNCLYLMSVVIVDLKGLNVVKSCFEALK